MKSITQQVLLAALAEYACYPASPEAEVEANLLHARISAITPDVVPVPDGEEMEVMIARYLAKFGVDALRLSCSVALSAYTVSPQHLDEGAEGAKSRNLALRLRLSADDSARYERLVAGDDSYQAAKARITAGIEAQEVIANTLQAVKLAGYKVRHDINGFYLCTPQEAAYEDAGHPSCGFDGRKHWHNVQDVEVPVETTGYERQVVVARTLAMFPENKEGAAAPHMV